MTLLLGGGGEGGVGEKHVSPVSARLIWTLKTVERCVKMMVLSTKSGEEKNKRLLALFIV